jgi:hypothetical protein
MQSITLLQKCIICGLEAHSLEDLDLFTKDNRKVTGHVNLCKACCRARWRTPKYLAIRNRANAKNHPMRLKFKGNLLNLRENPRTNICSQCDRKYPEELKIQTSMHHLVYDESNPIAHTLELCAGCHARLHHTGFRKYKAIQTACPKCHGEDVRSNSVHRNPLTNHTDHKCHSCGFRWKTRTVEKRN